jgi:hypothetical protein
MVVLSSIEAHGCHGARRNKWNVPCLTLRAVTIMTWLLTPLEWKKEWMNEWMKECAWNASPLTRCNHLTGRIVIGGCAYHVTVVGQAATRVLPVGLGRKSQWRSTSPRKALCSASAANVSAKCSAIAVKHPGVLLVERLAHQQSVLPHSSTLSPATVEETTQPTTGVVWSRRVWWRLLCGRLLNAARGQRTKPFCRCRRRTEWGHPLSRRA